MFGPEFIRINKLIKTARSAVSKNRAERSFFYFLQITVQNLLLLIN